MENQSTAHDKLYIYYSYELVSMNMFITHVSQTKYLTGNGLRYPPRSRLTNASFVKRFSYSLGPRIYDSNLKYVTSLLIT